MANVVVGDVRSSGKDKVEVSSVGCSADAEQASKSEAIRRAQCERFAELQVGCTLQSSPHRHYNHHHVSSTCCRTSGCSRLLALVRRPWTHQHPRLCHIGNRSVIVTKRQPRRRPASPPTKVTATSQMSHAVSDVERSTQESRDDGGNCRPRQRSSGRVDQTPPRRRASLGSRWYRADRYSVRAQSSLGELDRGRVSLVHTTTSTETHRRRARGDWRRRCRDRLYAASSTFRDEKTMPR